MISHMVTLSLPFCLLYLCSVFKVQSWISDVGYWILDLIPIPFLKTIVLGVPLPVFKRLPSRITCRFNLPSGSTSSHTLPCGLCVSRRFALQAFTWISSGLFTLCFQKASFPNCLRVYPLVGSSGLEPPTSRLSGVRSNHLSYEPMFARTFGRRPLSGPWWR